MVGAGKGGYQGELGLAKFIPFPLSLFSKHLHA